MTKQKKGLVAIYSLTKRNQQVETQWAWLQTAIISRQPSVIDSGRSRDSVWDPNHRRVIKEESKVIDHNTVYNKRPMGHNTHLS